VINKTYIHRYIKRIDKGKAIICNFYLKVQTLKGSKILQITDIDEFMSLLNLTMHDKGLKKDIIKEILFYFAEN